MVDVPVRQAYQTGETFIMEIGLPDVITPYVFVMQLKEHAVRPYAGVRQEIKRPCDQPARYTDVERFVPYAVI